MRIKKQKLKAFIRRKLPYFAGALLMLFSSLTYLFIFRPAPAVKAATVGTSSSNTSVSATRRQMVVSSNGTIVVVYNAGSESPSGLVYSRSNDNGASWSSPTQIDSSAGNISVTIDRSDNIFVSYDDASGLYIRKLTYSSGSWTIGAEKIIHTNTACNPSPGSTYSRPSVAITSDDKVFVHYNSAFLDEGNGCSAQYYLSTAYSTDLDNWNYGGSPIPTTAGATIAVVSHGRSQWGVLGAWLYVDRNGSGIWTEVPGAEYPFVSSSNLSISYGLDEIHFLYNKSGQVNYRKYSVSTATISAETIISSNSNDSAGQLVTDSHNIWAVYRQYVATSSYNIVFKRYDGSSWSGSATAITTDNLNNNSVLVPERVGNTVNVPVVWTTGTSSPYTLNGGSFSTIGSITDSGTRSESYTGSLTGSNGDTIVKCGNWFYDTVNIVAGMTVKVCPSNGQAGGELAIYANSITVAGTVDGASRGLPGGVGLASVGGTGGYGGAGGTATTGGPGGAGTAGSSYSGGIGAGSHAGSGGAAGANAAGGAAGGSGGMGGSNLSGGAGGAGGYGTSASAGVSGSSGGYLSASGNGDTSKDISLTLGSGAGAGGSGGSGSGGGGGEAGDGMPADNPEFPGINDICGGHGGSGGNGGAGGRGGKGGNGGGIVRLTSNSTLMISGTITVAGQTGSSGGSAQAGSNGQNGFSSFAGSPNCGDISLKPTNKKLSIRQKILNSIKNVFIGEVAYASHCSGAGCGGDGGSTGNNAAGGNTGTDHSGGGGGGGGGSAAGGNGGHGSGGGVLVRNTSSTISISGSIDARGGNNSTTNGGTVKIFHFDAVPSTSGVSAGRIFISTGLSSTAPELVQPAVNETNVLGFPTFRFRSSDPESNNLQYKIEICSNSDCSSVIRTIDQTLDQTGWYGQDQAGATAYTASNVTSGSTVATYRLPTSSLPLAPGTQYWWRAYSIDIGSNSSSVWGPASETRGFTVAGVVNTQIGPGGSIIGGGHVQ